MKGKVVLITGATSGIGKETAIELARMGATVVFTSRNIEGGKATKDEIIRASGNPNTDLIFCDLASLDSIRKCCAEFRNRYHRLDVLINNAAIWDFKRRESKEGIENIFATNVLAPFLMTNLLLDLLRRSAPSRIINLTSMLHGGTIRFEDIEFKKGFSGFKAYGQSKLALILFTRLLAKKLEGSGVTVNCVHPGMVATNLARDANAAMRWFFRAFGKDVRKGAETSIYLASSPEVGKVTGEYFADMRTKRSSRSSYDLEMAQRLWDVSAKYVKL